MKKSLFLLKYFLCFDSWCENERKYVEYFMNGFASGLSSNYGLPVKFCIYSMDGIYLVGIGEETCLALVEKLSINLENFLRDIHERIVKFFGSKEFRSIYPKSNLIDVSRCFVLPFKYHSDFLLDYSIGFFNSLPFSTPIFLCKSNYLDLDQKIKQIAEKKDDFDKLVVLFLFENKKYANRFFRKIGSESVQHSNTGFVITSQIQDLEKIINIKSELKFGPVF